MGSARCCSAPSLLPILSLVSQVCQAVKSGHPFLSFPLLSVPVLVPNVPVLLLHVPRLLPDVAGRTGQAEPVQGAHPCSFLSCTGCSVPAEDPACRFASIPQQCPAAHLSCRHQAPQLVAVSCTHLGQLFRVLAYRNPRAHLQRAAASWIEAFSLEKTRRTIRSSYHLTRLCPPHNHVP